MEHFSIGIVSLVFAVFFPIVFFAAFQLRRLGAWSKRKPGPKDRVGFFLIVAAIFGFAVGGFAQPLWNKVAECKASGQPVASCVFFPK